MPSAAWGRVAASARRGPPAAPAIRRHALCSLFAHRLDGRYGLEHREYPIRNDEVFQTGFSMPPRADRSTPRRTAAATSRASRAARRVERRRSRCRPSARRGRRRRGRASRRPGSASSPRRSPSRASRGSPDLKIPEPTKTPSAPSCMQSAASAGVAMPPAVKVTTGSRPFSATHLTSSTARAAPSPRRRAPRRAAREPADAAEHRAHVRDRVDDVARAGLALRADHRRALGDAAQRLAEVRAAADERHRELPLVDVVLEVGRASAPRDSSM